MIAHLGKTEEGGIRESKMDRSAPDGSRPFDETRMDGMTFGGVSAVYFREHVHEEERRRAI